MPRRVEPHDRAPLLNSHDDDDDDDDRVTTSSGSTRSRVVGPSRTTTTPPEAGAVAAVGESHDEDDNNTVRGCMDGTMSLCGRSLLAVWHVSKLPFDTVINLVWHGNSDGADPTTPTPSSIDHVDDNNDARIATSSRLHNNEASATPVRIPSPGRVDERNSPLYKNFHPGKGYEALAAGTATRNPSPPTTTTVTSAGGGRLLFPDNNQLQGATTSSTTATVGAVPQQPSTHVPEADHSKIYTPHELMKRIDAIHPWLPLSKVKVDTPASESLTDTSSTVALLIPVSVTISGPLRRPQSVPLSFLDPDASASIPSLSDVEDFILEDLSSEYRVRHINITDINFLATAFEGDSARGGGGGGKRSLMASPSALRVDDDEDAASGEPYDVHKARVVGMIHNLITSVVERRGDPWPLRLVFTRCSFAPLDLLDTLRLPGGGFMEVLAFDRCPISDAHVSSLLRRARQDDGLFAHLRSLRLSGTLSSDAMRALLRYVDEEVEEPVLRELVVPNSCADVVGGHPIAIRLPRLMVNGKSIESYQPHRSRVSSLAM